MEEQLKTENDPAASVSYSIPPPPLPYSMTEKPQRSKAVFALTILEIMLSAVFLLFFIIVLIALFIGSNEFPAQKLWPIMVIWFTTESIINLAKIICSAGVLGLRNWARKALSIFALIEVLALIALPIITSSFPEEHSKHESDGAAVIFGIIFLSLLLLTFILDIVLPILLTRRKIKAAFIR